jgi:hypothetical protein
VSPVNTAQGSPERSSCTARTAYQSTRF